MSGIELAFQGFFNPLEVTLPPVSAERPRQELWPTSGSLHAAIPPRQCLGWLTPHPIYRPNFSRSFWSNLVWGCGMRLKSAVDVNVEATAPATAAASPASLTTKKQRLNKCNILSSSRGQYFHCPFRPLTTFWAGRQGPIGGIYSINCARGAEDVSTTRKRCPLRQFFHGELRGWWTLDHIISGQKHASHVPSCYSILSNWEELREIHFEVGRFDEIKSARAVCNSDLWHSNLPSDPRAWKRSGVKERGHINSQRGHHWRTHPKSFSTALNLTWHLPKLLSRQLFFWTPLPVLSTLCCLRTLAFFQHLSLSETLLFLPVPPSPSFSNMKSSSTLHITVKRARNLPRGSMDLSPVCGAIQFPRKLPRVENNTVGAQV